MERELTTIENTLKESDLTTGLELIQKLLSKYKSNTSFLQVILDRLYNLGSVMIQEKNFKPVFPLFQVLCKVCYILKDTSKLCDIKNNLSYCYRFSSQTNLALKECLEALEIAADTRTLFQKLPALHLNACAIYREDIKDLTIAKTHAELAYFFAKENSEGGRLKDKRTLAVACYNYALILEELKEKSNAIIWYREGLKFCEEKWNDIYMEQAFREKVNILSVPDQIKKPVLFKKRAVSQKNSTSSYKYTFTKNAQRNSNRPGTFRKKIKKNNKKYSLTPISNTTLPISSVDRSTGFYDNESEYRVKIRNIKTPVISYKNQRYTSETYRNPPKHKLSLLQSVIKIQKWYRKLKNYFIIQLKYDYILISIKSFSGIKYFLSIFKEIKSKIQNNEFFIEAWPLMSGIPKPKTLKLDLHSLCDLIKITDDESVLREKDLILVHCFFIDKSEIKIRKIEVLFSGERKISGEKYEVYIYLYQRVLEIEAIQGLKKLGCSIKLDPLQDLQHVQTKVQVILENLVIKSGELVFSLS
jgi:tetratricopeptide (TPR) repeat protein